MVISDEDDDINDDTKAQVHDPAFPDIRPFDYSLHDKEASSYTLTNYVSMTQANPIFQNRFSRSYHLDILNCKYKIKWSLKPQILPFVFCTMLIDSEKHTINFVKSGLA